MKVYPLIFFKLNYMKNILKLDDSDSLYFVGTRIEGVNLAVISLTDDECSVELNGETFQTEGYVTIMTQDQFLENFDEISKATYDTSIVEMKRFRHVSTVDLKISTNQDGEITEQEYRELDMEDYIHHQFNDYGDINLIIK